VQAKLGECVEEALLGEEPPVRVVLGIRASKIVLEGLPEQLVL